MSGLPNPGRAGGLYDPRYEHDACGVGFVARLDGSVSHDVVAKGLTVLQNLILTATPISSFRRYLADLGLGGFDLSTMPRELARPTLSLLDLARALAIEPQLLLLDEITASLPADLTSRVFSVARQLRAEGRSVIFISHRLAEVSALCDRATVLRDGKTVGVVEPAQGGEERIVKLMLGPVAEEVAAEAASPSTPATGAVAVEVRDLKAGTLNGVSFTLRFGEVLGVAALEGQGEKELFDCMAGVRRPESGQILVGGKARSFGHPADAIRAASDCRAGRESMGFRCASTAT